MSATLEPGLAFSNWGRCESAEPAFAAAPASVREVQQVVVSARERGLRVKPLGAGHSFSGIGMTDGVRVDLTAMSGLLRVRGTRATLGAGTFLWQLPALLAPHGLALQNMGDIDRQTISGAIATGTHGTGGGFGGLATRVSGLTLVTADGTVLSLTREDDPALLAVAAVGLGALGIVVEVEVDCVPAFLLRGVERQEALGTVLDGFGERVASADHFEFYWFPHTRVALTKTNTRLPLSHGREPLGRVRTWFDDDLMANSLFAGTVSLGRRLPALVPTINRISARMTGHRQHVDHSYRVFAVERRVRFREMEYAVPVEEVPQALRELDALIERRRWNISFPVEVRAAAADNLVLSTASGRATGYIAVHRYYREDPGEYFTAVEAIMRAHGGRPHWGKMHARDAESLREAYPRFDEFVAVRDRLDPHRVFANEYLDRVIGA
ncbi:D-arabinono-1,4-lactone oxidase [Glaciihabitans sp. dw_435]|uniref:D-arabinono-1,4-lactone oxidase n=1 Tax=Glaciihabitans sp. dw_435 TaxID=2720081 RepID=UPI001BD3B39B|nr:D-arabinono-1,4-lactone oxidase [Glaciihabitans sp. dw_435]